MDGRLVGLAGAAAHARRGNAVEVPASVHDGGQLVAADAGNGDLELGADRADFRRNGASVGDEGNRACGAAALHADVERIVVILRAAPAVYGERHLVGFSGDAGACITHGICAAAVRNRGQGISARAGDGDGVGAVRRAGLREDCAVCCVEGDRLAFLDAAERDVKGVTAVLCALPGYNGKRVCVSQSERSALACGRFADGLELDDAFGLLLDWGGRFRLIGKLERLQKRFGCRAGGFQRKNADECGREDASDQRQSFLASFPFCTGMKPVAVCASVGLNGA